jgi:DNA-binding response OmpR family regulator
MRKKILVIDDDPDILDAVQMLLESEGFSVTTSTNGNDVEKLCETLPDLILLDILLSGNDGREIAKKVKRREKTKNIPIVMMSAHPTAQKSIKKYLADDYIAKPFDIDILLNKIKTYSHHR